MHLAENLNIISKLYPDTYKTIYCSNAGEKNRVLMLDKARNGLPTILYKNASDMIYLHSKYDPVLEAQRFIGQYSDVDRFKYVFFYGVGMGYHIEEFCKKWPDKKITIYEPEKDILLYFLEERQLSSLPLDKCNGIYTGSSNTELTQMLQQYINQINGEVLFVVLPSYERVFADKYRLFLEAFHTAINNKRSSLQAETDFQKLWTINSIKNFKEVMSSSNMINDKRKYFADKPAIIAAAGPSLEDELANLHFIKDKGLAYIFSVGSAINTLLANNILPDAVCIYDPAPNTNEVIRQVKERGLEIPLIFGSSVYSEAVHDYPGPKLHILTSQDTISSFFLNNSNEKKYCTIIDAPSIAIITLQMLIMLGCAPVILVGQNFAYRNSRYYARGIEYISRSGELQCLDSSNALETEDVHGGMVQTSPLFNHMRNQMEMYIDYCRCEDIVNTTEGGAKIKGTIYKPLKELLEKELLNNTTVVNWFVDTDIQHDINYMICQAELLLKERKASEDLADILIGSMGILGIETRSILLKKALNSFEEAYNKLIVNSYFNQVLKPMNRIKFEKIEKNITDISEAKEVSDKASFIIDIFGDVFEHCKKDMHSTKKEFNDMLEEVFGKDIKMLTFTIKAC